MYIIQTRTHTHTHTHTQTHMLSLSHIHTYTYTHAHTHTHTHTHTHIHTHTHPRAWAPTSATPPMGGGSPTTCPTSATWSSSVRTLREKSTSTSAQGSSGDCALAPRRIIVTGKVIMSLGTRLRCSLEPRPSSPRFYLAALEKNRGVSFLNGCEIKSG